MLETSLRAFHPFMPFITEEIHAKLTGSETSLEKSAFPKPAGWKFEKETREIQFLIEVVTAIRNIRGENNIPVKSQIALVLWTENADIRKSLEEKSDLILRLTNAEKIQWASQKMIPKKMAHAALSGLDIYVPLEGLVDLDLEMKRLEKEIGKLKEDAVRRQKRLEDENFVKRADADVVEEEREKLKEVQLKAVRLEETLKNLL